MTTQITFDAELNVAIKMGQDLLVMGGQFSINTFNLTIITSNYVMFVIIFAQLYMF